MAHGNQSNVSGWQVRSVPESGISEAEEVGVVMMVSRGACRHEQKNNYV